MNNSLPPLLMLRPKQNLQYLSRINEVKSIEMNPMNTINSSDSEPDHGRGHGHGTETCDSVTRTESTASMSTLQDLICQDPYFYYFFAATGILMPFIANETDWSVRVRYAALQAWVVVLNCSMMFVFVVNIASIIVYSKYRGDENGGTSETTIDTYFSATVLIQIVCLQMTIFLLRKEMTVVRKELIFYYSSSLRPSIHRCICILIIITPFIFSDFIVLGGANFSISLTGLTAFPLMGASAILISDQRIAHMLLSELADSIKHKSLSMTRYFDTGSLINNDARNLYFALLIIPAGLSSLFCVIALFLDAQLAVRSFKSSQRTMSFISIFVDGLLREVFVLLLLLYEMARVNEVSERFLPALARETWTESGTEGDRVSVYMAVQQFPLGAKVFGYQPSRKVIILQMVSTVASLVLGIASRELKAAKS